MRYLTAASPLRREVAERRGHRAVSARMVAAEVAAAGRASSEDDAAADIVW